MTLTNGNAWTNVSPMILGPQNSFAKTNSVQAQRFYRIIHPAFSRHNDYRRIRGAFPEH
jgi:hypothetical protein